MPLDHLVRPDASPPDARGRRPWRRTGRLGLVVAGVLVAAVVAALVLHPTGGVRRSVAVVTGDRPMVFSDRVALVDLWDDYKDTYLEQGSRRTVDPARDGATTSEGESYTMLRAVWTDDQKTFADSWQWTKDNLGREDHLLSWQFGRKPDGTYGVRDDIGGQNAASDADGDIAFALLMAYSRWQQDDYLYDAIPLIQSIWDEEVVEVDGGPVLAANDLERHDPDRVLVNPSYFAPYEYRVFAKVDPDPSHAWGRLVDNGYRVLQELNRQPLDAGRASGLTPDWVHLSRRDGSASPVGDDLTTDFGYDALRLPWRLALDWQWYHDERARQLLERHAVLGNEWQQHHRLVAGYHRDGTPAADYEAPAMYGGAMGYFTVVQPRLARQVFRSKLLTHYDQDTLKPTPGLGYYDSNWVWFGMALYLHELPNLTATQGASAP